MRSPSGLPVTVAPDDPIADPAAAPARSRRALLAAALGALGGSLATAIGRPSGVDAAAGDNLKLGQTNFAGASATRLNATSSGGAFWMTQNGSGSGVRGDSTNGHGGVFTTAHQHRYGLYAQQLGVAGTGAAVKAEGGVNEGVYGTSDSNNGVRGDSVDSSGVAGVSTNSYGVRGDSFSSDGVYGQSLGPGGIGVRGYSGSGTGGVFATAHPSGQGLLAQQLGAAGNGAALRAEGGSNVGVYGTSDSKPGVFGYSTSSYGVYGYSISSHAGYLAGSCYADSFVSPAAPSIRLDHPLAPATKVLAHAAVVSDAPATLYSGTATTDAAGEATVQLPAWFEALNTDLRYQLTPFADVRAWIKSEVSKGRFTIATSEPGTKVSWLLSGVRSDAYAKAHPLAVESRKTGKEKGKYLTPIELGQPESTGVDWEARQQAKAPLPVPAG